MAIHHPMNRRQFMLTTSVVGGAFVLGFAPRTRRAGAVAAAAAQVKLEAEPAIKTPDQFKLLGRSLQRLDVLLKVNGTATYGIDVRLPDMLYASVVTCPVFGGTLKRDDGKQAVSVAKALGGRPVKLIWTRGEDMRHDFYRPMSALHFRAGLNSNGVPVAWFNRSVTHSILSGIRPDDVKNGIDRTSVEGLTNMPYSFAQHRIEHLIQNTHVPVAIWRSAVVRSGVASVSRGYHRWRQRCVTPFSRSPASVSARCP